MDAKQLTRRNILKVAALAGTGSLLSGCWPFTRRPTLPCQSAPTIQGPLLTIDAHCHIFNGSDLQVEDFFQKVVWNEKGILAPVSEAVAAILKDLAWTGAPDGDDELHMLDKFKACLGEPARSALVKYHHDDRYRRARSALLDTRALRSMEQNGAPRIAGPFSASRAASRDNVLAEIHQRLQPKSSDEYKENRDKIYGSIQIGAKQNNQFSLPNASAQLSATGALDYLLENFQYRYGAMQDYLTTYAPTHGRSVDLMIACMVDYDWWLSMGRRPVTTLKKQVEVMAKISILSQGQVHGFVPFDPLREVAYRAGKIPDNTPGLEPVVFSSLELVKDAIENQGCLGVKLYPPMGYAPYCNADLPVDLWRQDWLPPWMLDRVGSTNDKALLPIGQRLDEALSALYTWCSEHEVPIMAHSNASNGVIQQFKDLAGSKYWAAALKRWPNLRISFGHLGGFSEPDTNGIHPWAQFINLMDDKKYQPGTNAYADAAYFSEVLGENTLLRDRIIFEYGISGSKPSILPKRLMYGTDWNLLINFGDIKAYLSDFISVFDAVDKATQAHMSERFFGYNAVEWIGLKEGMPARNRLKEFYKNNDMDITLNPPAWMKKVDSAQTFS